MDVITQIAINLIDPHPENPRKNLGDLTELAESIKANGIMQNLTVIPKDGNRYTVVIGHRRLAAAKKAGLTTVPCAIIHDMDRKTQLSTMLLENMQRSELSYIEQADGFQLMLDLGETVESISELSGFSKETVKHRLEIAKLDKKNIVNNDLTLDDFAYLEKISDLSKRNDILKTCNHNNIKTKVDDALSKEKEAEAVAEWKQHLLNLGLKELFKDVEYRELQFVKSFYCKTMPKENFTVSDEDEEYFFKVCYDTWVYIYKKNNQTLSNEEAERKKAEEERVQRIERLGCLFEDLNTDLCNFITEMQETKNTISIALRLWIQQMVLSPYDKPDIESICNAMDIELIPNVKFNESDISAGKFPTEILYQTEKRPGAFIIKVLLERNPVYLYHRFNGEYIKKDFLQCLIKAIEKLGYIPTEEQKQLINGTHKAYTRRTNNEQA